MDAKELAALTVAPAAQERRQADLEVSLNAILQACKKAASEGGDAVYMTLPRSMYSEFLSVLRALDFEVLETGSSAGAIDVTITWAAAVKELRGS